MSLRSSIIANHAFRHVTVNVMSFVKVAQLGGSLNRNHHQVGFFPQQMGKDSTRIHHPSLYVVIIEQPYHGNTSCVTPTLQCLIPPPLTTPGICINKMLGGQSKPKPNHAHLCRASCLLQTLLTESALLTWVLCCERVIQRSDHRPSGNLSPS